MTKITAKEIYKLSLRDFENGAVVQDIHDTIKTYEAEVKRMKFVPKTKAAWVIKNVLEQAIESHQKWIDYIQYRPTMGNDVLQAVGNIRHHKNCIEKYQRALEALKSIQTMFLNNNGKEVKEQT